MSRLISAMRAWPMPARIVSAALLAAVFGLMVFAAMLTRSARHAAAPTTTTTVATQAAGGPYPLPPPTSTSVVPTTRPQRTSNATTPPMSPSAATRMTTVSDAASSTTTTAPAAQDTRNTEPTYCTARVSDPNPAAGAPETVTVDSSSPRAPLSLQVLYQNGPQTYPQPGQAPATTDASGHGSVTFVVAHGSDGYPVVVEVNIASHTDECETHFVPSSN